MPDITRSGGREYTDEQYRRVVTYLEKAGRVVGNKEIAADLNLGGRTIRAVFRDIDGYLFVLNIGDSGVGIAGSVDESERGSARLRATARALIERADRRDRWANAHLSRVQGRMW